MDLVFRIIFIMHMLSLTLASIGSQCTFPPDWRGTWYQSMLGDIEINLHNISHMGHCVEKEDNKYLLFDRKSECFKCLVFTSRHKNILQYKAGYCYKQNSLTDVCRQITGDDPLHTIVKVHSEPVPCPFQGPYLFSYTNESNTECAEPMSEIQACADSSIFKFKFKHCRHSPQTHNQNLNFQCYATWINGERFLYGKFTSRSIISREQMYRCFMFSFWGTRGEMSMSADASCLGLQSTSVGGMTMNLHHRGDNQASCSFPYFFTMVREWRDLAGKYRIIVDKDRETFRLLDAADPIYGNDIHTETRLSIKCIDKPDNGDEVESLNILTYTTNDTCVSQYQCIRLSRHSHSVLELSIGTASVDQYTICHNHNFRHAVKHILIPHGSPPSTCPFPGSYAYVDRMSDCGGRISVGCGNDAQIIVESSCPSGHQSVEILQCYYNWTVTEKEAMYIIAGRPGDIRQTDCLVYKRTIDGFEIHAEEDCGGGRLRIMNKSINYIINSPAEQCQVEDIVYKSTQGTQIKSIQASNDTPKIINSASPARWSTYIVLTLVLTILLLVR